jgi:hypothetical protein
MPNFVFGSNRPIGYNGGVAFNGSKSIIVKMGGVDSCENLKRIYKAKMPIDYITKLDRLLKDPTMFTKIMEINNSNELIHFIEDH